MPVNRRPIYLAYGSNLHPRRLEARVGPVESLGVVKLPGWSLRFDKRGGDGSAKANLLAAPGSKLFAFAAAYAVTRDQMARLDVFEGCGRGYETLPLSVIQNDRSLHGFTYLAPSQWISSALLPFDWYVELIVSGARYHGLGPSYVETIERQPSRRDPDIERARAELRRMDIELPAHYKT